MKLEEFRQAVSGIDGDLIADAYACEEKIKRRKARSLGVFLLAAASAALLALPCALFFALRAKNDPPVKEPAATVYIDADQSVAIEIDRNGNVLSLTGADDGIRTLYDAGYIGKPLYEAVAGIVGPIKEASAAGGESVVLMTVKSRDESVEEALNRDFADKDYIVTRYYSSDEKATENVLDEDSALDLALQGTNIWSIRKENVSYSEVAYRESSNTYRVFLQLYNGREYHITVAAENGTLLVAWQRETLLQKEQIDAIINGDLGRGEGECIMYAGGSNGTRVACQTGFSGECGINYLIDRKTGEILCKEYANEQNGFSADFSIRAAIYAEKDAGISDVTVQKIECLSAPDSEYQITLASDGDSVVYRVSHGVAAERKKGGA